MAYLTVTWDSPSSEDSCTATERTDECRRHRVHAHLRIRCISSSPLSMLRARHGVPAQALQCQSCAQVPSAEACQQLPLGSASMLMCSACDGGQTDVPCLQHLL